MKMEKVLCKCGCGGLAPIAPYTSKIYGWVMGQPKKYIHGHNARGHVATEETKKKMSESNKGQIPWHVGTPRFKAEDNPMWKGNKVKYGSLHDWIKTRLAKPFACNHCGKIKPLDLASKSRTYKRELDDWLWLCRKCHVHYDNIYLKRIQTLKRKRGEYVYTNS